MNAKLAQDGVKEDRGEEMLVSDGVVVWLHLRKRGAEKVTVRKVAAETVKMGLGSWAREMNGENQKRWERFELTVVGEDEIEGQKMYVLEGKSKTDRKTGRPEQSKKVWVGQEDLFVHRDVTTRAQKDPTKPWVRTVEFTGIKVDQKVDPELFKYTPPKGVQVQDMTGGK